MNIDSMDDDQDLIHQSNYYTIEEFNSTFNLPIAAKNSPNQNFTLLHLNMRSLNKIWTILKCSFLR